MMGPLKISAENLIKFSVQNVMPGSKKIQAPCETICIRKHAVKAVGCQVVAKGVILLKFKQQLEHLTAINFY